jgi:hypothetical protein
MDETPTTTGRQAAAATPPLAGLEPRACWRHFEQLIKLARQSRHEEPAIEHVRA